MYFIRTEEEMSKSVRDDCVRDESELAPICIPICVNNTRRMPRLKISHPTRKNAFVVFRFSPSRAASAPSPLPTTTYNPIDKRQSTRPVTPKSVVLKSNSNLVYRTAVVFYAVNANEYNDLSIIVYNIFLLLYGVYLFLRSKTRVVHRCYNII